MRFWRALYIHSNTYYYIGAIIVLYIIGSFLLIPIVILHTILILFIILVIFDCIKLFRLEGIRAKRNLPNRLSNGDNNIITIDIENKYPFSIYLNVMDEIPEQFQIRNMDIREKLSSNDNKHLQYILEPKSRGEYEFGYLNIFVRSTLNLIVRKYRFEEITTLSAYPSFLKIKEYRQLANNFSNVNQGFHQRNRIAQTNNFDQIKEYSVGDDTRLINWKASAKSNQLMLNQYKEERSQHIYNVIDKGRAMQMPFNGLSLLDYAINASIALANIAVAKDDKAGLITFSNDIENVVPADNKRSQLELINNKLYHIDTLHLETDFSKLYQYALYHLKQRGLFIIYTNFETKDALQRQLKYIKALNKIQNILIIIFRNVTLEKSRKEAVKSTIEIFDKAIIEEMILDKKWIVSELMKAGIQTIISTPEELTIHTIHQYLALKNRGII